MYLYLGREVSSTFRRGILGVAGHVAPTQFLNRHVLEVTPININAILFFFFYNWNTIYVFHDIWKVFNIFSRQSFFACDNVTTTNSRKPT